MSYLLFLTVTTVTVTSSQFLIVTFSYKALQCLMKFTVHVEGIVLQVESFVDGHWFEVRSECAVVPSCHGDILTVEHFRIAFRLPGDGLRERIVRIAREELVGVALAVESENTLILFASLHLAVAAQNGFYITAQVCVRVPTVEVDDV